MSNIQMDGLWDTFTDWIGETWDSAKAQTESWYDSAQSIVASGEQAVMDKINEAQDSVQKAVNKAQEVKKLIDMLPEGEAKEELRAKFAESEGFFNSYVLPAWEKFADLAGLSSLPPQPTTMGLVPIVAIAGAASVVAAALTVIYVANRDYDLKEEIMKDPRLKTAQDLSSALEAGSVGLGNIFGNLKYVTLAIGIGVIGYLAYRFIPKGRN